jgi:alanine dehydrogenase
MNFGVPKEIRPVESRVGLTQVGADTLIRAANKVFIEHSAGEKAGFTDKEYESVGAQIVYSAKEVYGRADTIVKIGRPMEEEYDYFVPSQIIFSFLHLAVASSDLLKVFLKEKTTAIGYETIEKDEGALPILQTTSEIAGRIAPTIAGELLDSTKGGRGILLSGIPGTASAAVVILGAGILGTNAARVFHNLGSEVTLIDNSLEALQKVDTTFNGKIGTMYANPHNITKAVAFSDVLICTAAKPGSKAPILVTRHMLTLMSPRSVIIDYAINSGGNVETSRPTTLMDPFFIEENIIHYCVPNVPSRVARSGSYAHSNALVPYLIELGQSKFKDAIKNLPELKRGINTVNGELVHPVISAELDM